MAVLGSPLSAHPGSVWDLLEVCEVSRENDLSGNDAFKVRVKCYSGLTLNFVFVFNDHAIEEIYSGVFITTVTDTESIFYFYPAFSYTFDDLVTPVTLDFGVNDRYALWDNGDEPDVAGDLYGAEYRVSSFISDNLDLSDTALCEINGNSINDTITFNDDLTRIWFTSKTIDDSVSFGDTLSGVLFTTRVTDDTISLSDSASDIVSVTREVDDSVLFSDTAFGTIHVSGVVNDSITLNDTAFGVLFSAKTTDDAVVFTETVFVVLYSAKTVDDVVILTDTISGILSTSKITMDSVTFSDVASGIVFVSGIVNDSITFSDTASCVVFVSGAVSDSITLSDTAYGLLFTTKTIDDTVTITDTASDSITTYNRTLSDSVSLSGNIDVLVLKTITETVTFTDTASCVVFDSKTVSDIITLTDITSGIVSTSREVSDTIALVDDVYFLQQKAATDIVSFSETLSRTLTIAKSNTDAIVLVDTIPNTHPVHNRTKSDSVSFSDSLVAFVLKNVRDTITFSDSVTQAKGKGNTDTLTLSESLSRAGSVFRRSLSETLSLSDTVIGYSPILCEDILQDTTNNTILTYPFTSPTHTATLPNADFGDSETLVSPVEIRMTRGNTRVNARNTTWFDDTILSLDFQAMTEDEANDLVDLIEASAGDEIKLTDHENQVWKGVITSPVVPVLQGIGSCKYKTSFVFEGTLQ